jgi:hypothetical protein
VVFDLYCVGCQARVLRLGGIGLYRKAQPFFFGIIAGFFFPAGFSFLSI